MSLEENTNNNHECDSHNLIIDKDSLVLIKETNHDILGRYGMTIGIQTISTYECQKCHKQFQYKSEGCDE